MQGEREVEAWGEGGRGRGRGRKRQGEREEEAGGEGGRGRGSRKEKRKRNSDLRRGRSYKFFLFPVRDVGCDGQKKIWAVVWDSPS